MTADPMIACRQKLTRFGIDLDHDRMGDRPTCRFDLVSSLREILSHLLRDTLMQGQLSQLDGSACRARPVRILVVPGRKPRGKGSERKRSAVKRGRRPGPKARR